jgi:DNA anti-recombination protein RmuC
VSAIEGTIANQDRIFDMLHEGQQNLRSDIAGLRAEMRDDMDKWFGEMNTRFGEMNTRFGEMNTRFGEVDKRFAEMNTQFGGVDARIAVMDIRLNTKIDSNLKWILGVQIAMWVTIIAAVLL